MKGWRKWIAAFACMAAVIMAIAIYCGYRHLMGDVRIMQYFVASADNLDWQSVRMRVIVPEDRYREGWTENAMRLYVIIRSRNIPDRIDMVLYGSMEEFQACEEYAEATFEK